MSVRTSIINKQQLINILQYLFTCNILDDVAIYAADKHDKMVPAVNCMMTALIYVLQVDKRENKQKPMKESCAKRAETYYCEQIS